MDQQVTIDGEEKNEGGDVEGNSRQISGAEKENRVLKKIDDMSQRLPKVT